MCISHFPITGTKYLTPMIKGEVYFSLWSAGPKEQMILEGHGGGELLNPGQPGNRGAGGRSWDQDTAFQVALGFQPGSAS